MSSLGLGSVGGHASQTLEPEPACWADSVHQLCEFRPSFLLWIWGIKDGVLQGVAEDSVTGYVQAWVPTQHGALLVLSLSEANC